MKGKLLIASPQMLDPNFAQAVVLLIQHDDNGAMGVLVNRALEITVKEACEPVESLECEVDAPLHAGGPCEGPLIALHTRPEAAEGEVLPGLFFVMERTRIELLLRENPSPIKFIANYAGWAAGQLEAEVEEGSWLVLDARADTVFDGDARLWAKLLAGATLGPWIRPELMPEDPSLN